MYVGMMDDVDWSHRKLVGKNATKRVGTRGCWGMLEPFPGSHDKALLLWEDVKYAVNK